MVMVAMMVAASTVHPHSATTAMASHKATRAIEEEVVAALTEAEAAEDQGDSIVAATEVALVAEAMTATGHAAFRRVSPHRPSTATGSISPKSA